MYDSDGHLENGDFYCNQRGQMLVGKRIAIADQQSIANPMFCLFADYNLFVGKYLSIFFIGY